MFLYNTNIYKNCDDDYNIPQYYVKWRNILKIIALFLAIFLLFGSAPAVYAQTLDEAEEATEVRFVAPKRSSPKVAVMRYFSALYDSYTAMLPVDITPIIDTDFEMMQNVLNWNTLLQMRRSIISKEGYCYVETERFDYEIEYIKKRDLDDQRMDYVNLKKYGSNAVVLHFVIKGEEGKVYPPIFAVNSQHTVIITEDNEGEYKIAYHYFPGSEGKFENDLPVELMEKEEMEALLSAEFENTESFDVPEAKFERLYNPEKTVEYALTYCEKQNPDFYFVGDWYGNCMNFTSQSVWTGFREEGDTPKNTGTMLPNWYCTKGGGTLPWSSVSRFWNWTTGEKCGLQTVAFYNVNLAKEGDIVNIGSYVCEMEEKYTHALVLVDEEKLLLAQNSPACFVYYSDLVNNYSRFIRPVSINA